MMTADRRRKVLALTLRRLAKEHGRPTYRSGGSGVGELVGTILSQNTSAANSSAGFRRLWRRFRSWAAVADAPVQEIERCIRVAGLSRIKAPRIRRILQQIRAGGVGRLACKPCSPQAGGASRRVSLEFLRSWPVERAYQYLLDFDGVGPKTAACVLLFAFGKPLFPVDTHILRIALRLGALPAGTSAGRAQEILAPLIPPRDRLAMHLLLITHGRLTCRALPPRCPFCSLLDFCPVGRKTLTAEHAEDAENRGPSRVPKSRTW